jgi:hypothetical protein
VSEYKAAMVVFLIISLSIFQETKFKEDALFLNSAYQLGINSVPAKNARSLWWQKNSLRRVDEMLKQIQSRLVKC